VLPGLNFGEHVPDAQKSPAMQSESLVQLLVLQAVPEAHTIELSQALVVGVQL